jgi:hypothetical protein
MKSKDIVQAILPRTKAEKQKTNGAFGTHYFLVRNGRDTMYLGQGDTEAQAWADALPKVLEMAQKAIANFP